MESFYENFWEIVRGLRENRGLSQNSIANAIGVHRVTYTKMEQGREIPLHQVVSLAKALDFSLEDLIPKIISNSTFSSSAEHPQSVIAEVQKIRTVYHCSQV